MSKIELPKGVWVFDDVMSPDEVENTAHKLKWEVGWYLLDNYIAVPYGEIDVKTKDAPQLTHTFRFHDGRPASKHCYLSDSVLHALLSKYNLTIRGQRRVKANLKFNVPGFLPHEHNGAHVDYDDASYWVVIYYPIDSDGSTKIFARRRGEPYHGFKTIATIPPKKGRFVLMDGDYYHAASSPAEHPFRMVLNFNLDMDMPEDVEYLNPYRFI